MNISYKIRGLIMTFVLISLVGCTDNSVSFSEEELSYKQIEILREGTDYRGAYGKAVIYAEDKMFYEFYGESGCAVRPSKVKVSGDTLKIFYTNPPNGKACDLSISGPFGVIINLPRSFAEKENIEVIGVKDSRETTIPVFIKK